MAAKTKTTKMTASTKTKVAPVKKEAAPVVEKVPVALTVKPSKGRVLVGTVVSDKMQNTVVVEVTRLVAHPLYHKRMRHSHKFHAHNEMGAQKGDTVMIVETRPISKLKHFMVMQVLNKA